MNADDVMAVLEEPEFSGKDEDGTVTCPMPECEDGRAEYADDPSRSREEQTFTMGYCDLCDGVGRVPVEVALAAEIASMRESSDGN